MIKIKRVYNEPDKNDGFRILVDRLWPRGLSKDKAKVDLWLKDIAPTDELRKWYAHDPTKWHEFKKRYYEELRYKDESLQKILNRAKDSTVTLLYATREERFNNAVALKEFLEARKDKLS